MIRSGGLGSLLTAALLLPRQAAAAVPTQTAQSLSPLGSLLETVLGLGLVLALIFALAWLVRRFGQGNFSSQRRLKVVGGTLLGGRERVVIVELGERWLVLGVTPQHVNLLTELERPADAAEPAIDSRGIPPFADKLQAILRQARAGRSSH